MGCFNTPEECAKAFNLLDTDGNGLIDGRELLGALTLISRGRLSDRMDLLFHIFDLNKEQEMAYDEVFLMLRLTMSGLRKMVGIAAPPAKIVIAMTQQVYKCAQKHKDHRINVDDWYNWWSRDASCRNALKMFAWGAEDQRGLPANTELRFVDYAKAAVEPDQLFMSAANRVSLAQNVAPVGLAGSGGGGGGSSGRPGSA